MKDIAPNGPEAHARKINTKIITSWLRGVKFLKKKLKQEESATEEPTYDVEEIRRSEYPLLEREVYLDHTGTTLFPRSTMNGFVEDITSSLYGNPHSESSSSRLSTLKIEESRQKALEFFNASKDDFDLVFVQNATAAIKLVTEILLSHPEGEGGFWYGYHGDSHTSLVGIREVARAGYVCFDRDEDVENWINGGTMGNSDSKGPGQLSATRLFAYPGQSNMTGRRLSLSWPGRIRSALGNTNTYTLLDAAALASTGDLDLSNAGDAPDFVALSFYKIFGFPDLGALLVRRALGPMLRQRRYFGGGTVEMVLNDVQWHSLHAEDPHEYLEDGTLPFHNIIALGHALTTHERLYTSQKLVSRHTAQLAGHLYNRMTALRHIDGSPICAIYKDDTMTYGDPSSTGPTIAFNIRYADGTWVRLDDLEILAKKENIHLRTGGVCNPGGIAKSLNLAPWEFMRNYIAGTQCGHGPVLLGGKPSGIARVSLGAMSNTRDVDLFTEFLTVHFKDVLPSVEAPLEWTAGMGLRVAGLVIYPLEGAGAWRVPANVTWPVEESGLRWDRTWVLVDPDTGDILTREAAPRLLLLSCEVDVEISVLRVTPHKSLDSMSVGGTHLCLPLEGNAASGMQRAACQGCAEKDLQMLTSTVRRGDASVPARVCTSEHVVAFFSSALGSKCTVARVVGLSPCGTPGMQLYPMKPSKSFVVHDGPPSSSALVEGPDTSGTVVSTAHTNRSQGSDSPRLLEEVLAESMQANVMLARDLEMGFVAREKNWVFLTIGRHYTDTSMNGVAGSYYIARVAEDRDTLEAQNGAGCCRLLRGGREGGEIWGLEAGQKFVLQG